VLTEGQVDAIIEAASDSAKLAMLISSESGLRPNEVIELRWGDVQVQHRKRDDEIVERLVLRVRRGWVSGEVTATKTGKERIVPVSARLAAALPPRGEQDELVTTNSKGDRSGIHGLDKAFARAIKRAGVVGTWRLYDLRHYFCTTLFRSRVNPRAIMSLMGHASLNTTLRYAHVLQDDLYDAVDAADAFTAETRASRDAGPASGIVAHGKPVDSEAVRRASSDR